MVTRTAETNFTWGKPRNQWTTPVLQWNSLRDRPAHCRTPYSSGPGRFNEPQRMQSSKQKHLVQFLTVYNTRPCLITLWPTRDVWRNHQRGWRNMSVKSIRNIKKKEWFKLWFYFWFKFEIGTEAVQWLLAQKSEDVVLCYNYTWSLEARYSMNNWTLIESHVVSSVDIL